MRFTQGFSSPLLAGAGILMAGYVLGCFATGYYVVLFFRKKDIRQLGSGNVGARNVGRYLGTWGFIATFLGDTAKGAVAVWGATAFTGSGWLTALAPLAVVSGHIWPAQLGFRGGKGVATAFGALLVFDPYLTFAMVLLCLSVLPLIRKTVLAALITFALAPLMSVFFGHPPWQIAGTSALSALVLIAHRKNLLEEFAAMDSHRNLHGNSKKLSE